MKNKKTIALAMAAATVAPMAVPAFAAEIEAHVEAPNTSFVVDMNKINKRAIKEVPKNSVSEEMRKLQAEGKNPKIVFVNRVDGINGDVLISYDDASVTPEDTANHKAQLAEIEDYIAYAKTVKIPETGEPRYTITETITEYSLKNFGKLDYTPSTKVIKIQDNVRNSSGKFETKTYTILNFDTEFEEQEDVNVKKAFINLNATRDLDTEYKKLSAIEYSIKRAKKNNPSLLVTSEEDHDRRGNVTGYTIYIYKEDGITQIGRVKIDGKVDTKKLVKHVDIENDFANHWAETSISNAMLNGWVTMSESFRPKESITRAEFAQMIVEAFKLPKTSGNAEFTDVAKGDWYATPILTLANLGYVNGNPDGTFKPNAPITRQEAAKIMADIIVRSGAETFKYDANGKKINVDIKTNFSDDDTIASWADESVLKLTTTNVNDKNNVILNTTLSGAIITGDAGKNTFRGKDTISRAESVIMIERASTYGQQTVRR